MFRNSEERVFAGSIVELCVKPRMQELALNKRCGYPLSRSARMDCLRFSFQTTRLLRNRERFDSSGSDIGPDRFLSKNFSHPSRPNRSRLGHPVLSHYGRQGPHNQRWRSFVVPSTVSMSSQWADEPYSLISTHPFSQDVRRPPLPKLLSLTRFGSPLTGPTTSQRRWRLLTTESFVASTPFTYKRRRYHAKTLVQFKTF